MIEIKNITKIFNSRSKNKNIVLNNVSFELPEKGLVAIFGKSGSGKTTLLNILGGLDRQNSGKIYIDNEEITKNNIDHIRNSKIGFIFQNYYLEAGYSVENIIKNTLLCAGFSDENEINRRIQDSLNLVDMYRYKHKTADSLSGGQKQRVAIARALSKGSDIILADEPTGNLDSENTNSIMNILKEISKTRLVVLVTHEINLIEKYADDYIKIQDGQLIDKKSINNEIEENKEYIIEKKEDSQEKNNIIKNLDKSNFKKNGKLFTFSKTWKLKNYLDKNYSFVNIFKQIFIIVMSVLICFLSLFIFESINGKKDKKNINQEKIYTDINTYHEIRKLDKNLYKSIDLFNLNYGEAIFTFDNQYSAATIKSKYVPKPIDKNKNDLNLIFGLMPKDGEVLITDKLAKDLKFSLRQEEYKKDEALLLLKFNKKYKISGIVKGKEPYIYMSRTDYINFLEIYKELKIQDSTSKFFDKTFLNKDTGETINSYSSEISLYKDNLIDLKDGQAVIEINRNSTYIMVDDTKEVDYKIDLANRILLKQPEFISIANSYPVYISQIKLNRNKMDSDIRILVNENTLNNIFAYIEPNLDFLSNKNTKYYFEIKTKDENQKLELKNRLNQRGVLEEDIEKIYSIESSKENKKIISSFTILIFVIMLMLTIYYFIEKSGSIKKLKEYGVFRAIGVNKSNLIYKELVLAFKNSIITFLLTYIVTFTFMVIRYYIMNVKTGMFLLISILTMFLLIVLIMIISIIPYMFVFIKTPAQILSKYDI